MLPIQKKPRRALNGILLLDKPLGLSSNQALQIVKRLYQAEKAGHTGSLDPLASGMLPLCFGVATKFSQFLLEANKTYEFSAVLGIKTATGDAEGEVIAQKEVPPYTLAELDAACSAFRGQISQIPSMYSAVKVDGQALYKLARKGITIDRPSRQVMIEQLDLLDYEQNTLKMRVTCSKGTYIRTLVEDLGDKLGCGAYVSQLRRTQVAGLDPKLMVSLPTLEALATDQPLSTLDNHLLSLDTALQGFMAVNLSRTAVHYLQQGQAIALPSVPAQQKWVQLYYNGQFLGMGEVLADGRVMPSRLLRPKGLVA
ncbi:MAG TPA: tRNA pseudouridine(55) synthase TruB [Gammaproteobacteria bacterium]|nr:tRNA pseudouridine(55) synthase TruB [Gammaproteobacteria bacterium]